MELTWSMAPDGTSIPGWGASCLVEMLDLAFGGDASTTDLTTRPWFPLIAQSFNRWGELGGVELRYEPWDDGATLRESPGLLGIRGDIRLGATTIDGAGGILASSQYPDSADLVLDSSDSGRFRNPAGNYLTLRNTLMHEIGHTLGLGHVVSDDAAILMEPALQLAFDGPQLDDIRGLHYLYGDRFETANGGNDSPEQATPLGELPHGASIVIGGDGQHELIDPHHTDFVSIDSRDDRDYYSFYVRHAGWVDVVLEPLGGMYLQGEVGQPQFFINARASNNLDLSVLGPDTFRATAPGRRAGEAEMLTDLYVPTGGTYMIEITGRRDAVQLYQLQITYSAVVCEPSSVLLVIFMFPLINLHRALAKP